MLNMPHNRLGPMPGVGIALYGVAARISIIN
jgi:hypothetical protein